MNALAMMVFGSVARGDNVDTSDTDILVVVECGVPKAIKNDVLEIQYLTKDILMSMAKNGDLFALHLAIEGNIIFDHQAIFKDFRENMKVRDNYMDIKKGASDFGWFLGSYGDSYENQRLVNKRIAWCVRTILISKIVENGRFVFSPSGLKKEFCNKGIDLLIDLRRSELKSDVRFSALQDFLIEHGSSKPIVSTKEEFVAYFFENGPPVACTTITALDKKAVRYPPYVSGIVNNVKR